MFRFIVRRLLFGVLVLWLISVLVFVLFFVAPHDPARLIAGRLATPDTIALVRNRLGLDQPVLRQYAHFLAELAHGNLGYSYYNSESVDSLIAGRLPVTASLTLGAAVIWLLVGVGTGVLAARRPRSGVDRGATLFVILPWLTLAFVSAATYSRLTRGSLLEVLGEDFVRTARSKGISERRVIYRHALRSALTPVVTQLGIDVGSLLGGAIITETVFGLPGLGQLAVQSVTTQDLPVIIGIVLLASFFIVLANIVVDLLYAVLDPRVRFA